ncbi:MAG: lysophospholipid acyltransferase family protein [Planctomycetes bacterium]|nr:lysophospholipid acyltransferase family protein [Planctomycetota bacterium]
MSDMTSNETAAPAPQPSAAPSTPSPAPAAPAARGRTGGMGTAPPERAERNAFADALGAIGARLLLGFFRVLPGPVARAVARAVAALAYTLLGRKRRQMVSHMTIAFRDGMTQEEKLRWARGCFRHLALSTVEFARMTKLRKETLEQIVDLSEAKVFDELLAKGKGRGLLSVPAHHGNWELLGYAMALKGYPLISVARPLDNPKMNELVLGIRTAGGNRIIDKWQVLWKLKKEIDKGSIATMSIDQNGGTGGQFIPLFGTLASTVSSPADLYLAAKVPLVVCTLNRLSDGVRHKMHVWDVIEYEERSGSYEERRDQLLLRINAAYEKAIRTYPDQWLWGHKRWKTRPLGEKPGPDGLPPRVR